ncbi:polymer-forming cytoskeletal protein [Halovibrio sp. HP20-50]|uniref:bactofilin family protein n=1 Tax=Halovibrio sp. HP20-59 TaxID=3080275 RepID=UPI00294B8763|nr:polymer-forming cytoskeletal protein [Halovibrio sp. HP20-59]MEA2120235.1 polymer-forming cytoskeletal protein [Halovibrio sp. HP20-59]
MGIQVWFILLGVGVMTLIVWDGKRRKLKQRAYRVPAVPHQAHATSDSPMGDDSGEAIATFETSAPSVAVPPRGDIRGGSRIGVATQITGRVIADEPVLIKGCIEGAVIAPNHAVSVTASGYVASYLEGNSVDIDGRIVGTLKANTMVILLSRAHMQGIVEAPSLECMAGAWLQVEVAKKFSLQKIPMVS